MNKVIVLSLVTLVIFVVVTVGAIIYLEMTKPIAEKRFYISKIQRPVNLSYDEEWARNEARSKLVDAVTGEWRKLLCKQAGRAQKTR